MDASRLQIKLITSKTPTKFHIQRGLIFFYYYNIIFIIY